MCHMRCLLNIQHPIHILSLSMICCIQYMDHSRYGLCQWDEALHSNAPSHWLSPYSEWSLYYHLILAHIITRLHWISLISVSLYPHLVSLNSPHFGTPSALMVFIVQTIQQITITRALPGSREAQCAPHISWPFQGPREWWINSIPKWKCFPNFVCNHSWRSFWIWAQSMRDDVTL